MWLNLELKTRPKQLLGFLLFIWLHIWVMLPDAGDPYWKGRISAVDLFL